jgi:hypothetical protein
MILRSAVFALSWGMLSLVPLASQNLPPQFLPILGGTSEPGGALQVWWMRLGLSATIPDEGIIPLCRLPRSL